MPELLVLNPIGGRRKAKKTVARKRPRRKAARAKNPVTTVTTVRRAARRNVSRRPAVARRRRRNPIGGAIRGGSIMRILKGAAVGGVGAVSMDWLMGLVRGKLPTTMQPVPGQVGVYDALQAAATIFAGRALSKTTRGMSEKMAEGALVVQAYRIAQIAAAKIAPGAVINGIGYASPAAITRGTARISPIAQVGRYARPGTPTPLLSRYTGRPGPLLNTVAQTENVKWR